jgi:DNA polymerase-1
MSEKKLFLLDGHALVYRAHFAFINRPLINSKGVNTSAMTGFTRTLWDLMQTHNPSHIAVAFDPSGPTFRHEIYQEYKANREEQPDDIRTALPFIKRIVEGFNIPIVMVDTYEADDVIGTLSKQAEKEGFQVFMVTPDKDYAQLVSENIFMYKPSRQGNGVEILGVEEVREKWGVNEPIQVIDLLALQGDSSDNIPGVPGIGPKTASKLLKEFHTLEGLLANTASLKGKQKERVEENVEQAKLSKVLATIDLEVPIQFDAKRYEIEPFNRPVLEEVFKELEFRSLAKAILGEQEAAAQPGQQGSLFAVEGASTASITNSKAVIDSGLPAHAIANHSIENTAHDYQLVDTAEKRATLIKELETQSVFCFDTETTSIDANQAELVGISFSMQKGQAYYVPVPEDQSAAQAIVNEFKPVLENPKIQKIAQNIKYDTLVLKWYGVEIAGAFLDTMIMHYLLEPEMRHNMDYLAETYLSYKPVSIKTLIGKGGKNQLTMRQVPVEKVVDYAAEDADITWQLKAFLYPELEKNKDLMKLYNEMEEPLIKVLTEMEFEGVRLDVDFLDEYSKELETKVAEAKAKIYELAGVKFNIASPKQVGEVLFEKLNLPYRWRKTSSGQYSTNEEKLTELSVDFPIVKDILRHRGLTKLKSTYVDALPRMVNPKTGRIHTSYNQALAATGRLSSNNPNLQNIPIRTPEGAKVRKAFIPRDDNHVLLAADYSQIELRLIAEIAQDKAMLEAFQEGKDIHSATAAKVFEVPYEEVTKVQRYRAKTVNFSIVYGAGATNLSRQLDITRNEAKHLIDQYFKQYQGLQRYMADIVAEARENGYVSTLMGRRRYIRDINSKSSLMRSNAERIAVNTPVQGSAADMIKVAMIHILEALQTMQLKTKMILQVHDELVFDVPKEELAIVKPMIEEKMRNAMPSLSVPILVGMDEGANWLEAH